MMKTWRAVILTTALVLWSVCGSRAQDIQFDFDTGSPSLGVGQSVPLTQTVGGLTASFSAPFLAFSVQTEASAGLTLSQFFGKFIYPNNQNRNTLQVQFSQPVSAITLNFATYEFHDPGGTPSNIQLTAYLTSTALPPVGSTTTFGAVIPGDTFPQGTLSFSAGGQPFDIIQVVVPPQAGGTTTFAIDTMTVTTANVAPEPGSLVLLGVGLLWLASMLMRMRFAHDPAWKEK
jgi:hypothetical protein